MKNAPFARQAPTTAIEISCLWEFYKAFDIKDTWIEQVLSGHFPSSPRFEAFEINPIQSRPTNLLHSLYSIGITFVPSGLKRRKGLFIATNLIRFMFIIFQRLYKYFEDVKRTAVEQQHTDFANRWFSIEIMALISFQCSDDMQYNYSIYSRSYRAAVLFDILIFFFFFFFSFFSVFLSFFSISIPILCYFYSFPIRSNKIFLQRKTFDSSRLTNQFFFHWNPNENLNQGH